MERKRILPKNQLTPNPKYYIQMKIHAHGNWLLALKNTDKVSEPAWNKVEGKGR